MLYADKSHLFYIKDAIQLPVNIYRIIHMQTHIEMSSNLTLVLLPLHSVVGPPLLQNRFYSGRKFFVLTSQHHSGKERKEKSIEHSSKHSKSDFVRKTVRYKPSNAHTNFFFFLEMSLLLLIHVRFALTLLLELKKIV